MKIDLFTKIGKNNDKYNKYYLISSDNDTTDNDINNQENTERIIDFINYKKIMKTINDSIKPTFNFSSKNNKPNFKNNNYNNTHNNYNNSTKNNNYTNNNSQNSKYSNNNKTSSNYDFNNIKIGNEEQPKWKDSGGSALRKRLNGKNKQILEINGEINKLTESNIDVIFDKINVIVIDKNSTKIPDDKLKYIFDNIITKCINQPTFTSLYIKFLNKFNHNIHSKQFIKNEIKKIIENIIGFIGLIEIHDSQMNEKIIENKKTSNIFNTLIKNNKKYEGLGTIYSLFYINKFINCNMFVEFLKKTIQQVSDYIEWEPCTNEVLEKYVNVLIGLLEFGYHKIVKDIDYETKLTLQMKIENVLSSKKIEMRIKYNLQNLYDDLKAGKRKLDY
tara:strand:+ start:1137 stop:2303 length:1167 start_codon:yes stop_codon:yes gene_type:complete